MIIKAASCYNLDVLCFLNVMTANQFYIHYQKDDYERFYPLLSDNIKKKIQEMVVATGSSMISPIVTLLISSLDGFTNRDLFEMLESHEEIKLGMNASPYQLTDIELERCFSMFSNVIIPLIKELEDAGIREYWNKAKLPLINVKCDRLNHYFKQYNLYDLVAQYKEFHNSDVTMYVCAFSRPHGIKLCGYNMISDYTYKDDVFLSTLTHEMFHPPYDKNAVAFALRKLAGLSWVKEAYENQNSNCRYSSMDGFIEENIVEALGIFSLLKLGVNWNPMEYFKTHDYGSHVISPHFYNYLTDHKKQQTQTFEQYFMNFVDFLIP